MYWSNCTHLFVCKMYFLYCDTLKKLHHHNRHYITLKNTAILNISIKNIYHIQSYKSFGYKFYETIFKNSKYIFTKSTRFRV